MPQATLYMSPSFLVGIAITWLRLTGAQHGPRPVAKTAVSPRLQRLATARPLRFSPRKRYGLLDPPAYGRRICLKRRILGETVARSLRRRADTSLLVSETSATHDTVVVT